MIKGLKVRSERLLLTFSLNVERNPTTHSHTLMQNAECTSFYDISSDFNLLALLLLLCTLHFSSRPYDNDNDNSMTRSILGEGVVLSTPLLLNQNPWCRVMVVVLTVQNRRQMAKILIQPSMDTPSCTCLIRNVSGRKSTPY